MSGKGGGLQGFIDEGRARLGGGKPLSEILSQVRDNPAGFLPPPTQDAARAVGSLFGRPYEETPIGMFSSMRGKPIEEQLKVSESDPAWGFAGTTIGKGIRAFHGSPHSFDKFDLGKIGTGEGAQAYGHGLYFAEAEDVARSYRDALAGSNTRWMLGDRVLSGPEQNAATLLDWAGGNKDKAFASLRLSRGTRTADQNYLDATEAALREMDPAQVKVVQDTGHMYEVNINASPDEFLDWDKPLGQQPPEAVKALREGYKKTFGVSDRYLDDTLHAGTTIRDAIGAGRVSKPMTDNLSELGLPGIKYLDQGSRAAGDGSRNYVVFNPSLIEIMRKYGILAPVATFGAMAYGDNESANNGNR